MVHGILTTMTPFRQCFTFPLRYNQLPRMALPPFKVHFLLVTDTQPQKHSPLLNGNVSDTQPPINRNHPCIQRRLRGVAAQIAA